MAILGRWALLCHLGVVLGHLNLHFPFFLFAFSQYHARIFNVFLDSPLFLFAFPQYHARIFRVLPDPFFVQVFSWPILAHLGIILGHAGAILVLRIIWRLGASGGSFFGQLLFWFFWGLCWNLLFNGIVPLSVPTAGQVHIYVSLSHLFPNSQFNSHGTHQKYS